METTGDDANEAIQVRGTAFVEWAGPSAATLRQTLESVGFRAIGRHRRQDIVIMAQGEIRFLINTASGSHAARFAEAHGPSCAGMAFLVDDAAAAMAKALGRGAECLPSSDGSLVPDGALGGIGGSALYLVDRSTLDDLWADFESIPSTEGDDSARRLRRVDHLTHCVRPGEMARWVGFYKRLFGFEEVFKFVAGDATNGFDTIAVRDPLNNACVTVLEPMGATSQIQEFIDEYRGEGIQHLALLSDDLYGTVEDMRERGVEFLPTPKAYYDALAERMPNHGEDVSRLHALGMLIDGAATGENPDERTRLLLQIFTRKMIGPIFFEAIQRKGNRGFGEGNAKALFEAIKREQAVPAEAMAS